MIIKPMLAASMEDSKGNLLSLEDLRYPLMASIKLDGIRAIKKDVLLSRSFKPIPNTHIQKLTKNLPEGLDGELLVVGEEFGGTSSGVMSKDGEPNFEYHVFDFVNGNLSESFVNRFSKLKKLELPDFCKVVEQNLVRNANELKEFENSIVISGHEGVMVRSPDSPYKCGRSSIKEHYLIKIKRFTDSEAEIIGFEEKLHNLNKATTDELGYSKRSSSKEGMVPAGTLGTLLVKDIHDNRVFCIGTGKGLDDTLRKYIWANKNEFLGKIIKYKYQEVGEKDLPRIPSFQGFRNKMDIG